MSILTKIFVVLVTVLSVALVGMMVSFVARSEDYKGKYEDAVSKITLLDQTAKVRQAQITQLQENLNGQISSLNADKNRLEQENQTSSSKLAEASTENVKLKAEKEKAEADTTQLVATTKILADINQAIKVEVDQRREKQAAAELALIQITDTNNELHAQVDTLGRERKSLNERIVALEKANEDLSTKVASMPAKSETTPSAPSEYVPDVAIHGQVVATDKVDSVVFVKINVGTTDRVRENTKFMIHRKGDYVATMTVTSVDTKSSAGKVVLAKGDVMPGDEVLASPAN